MTTFEIYGHEYNEYVIGYVIHTSKGDINAQFDCDKHTNHPEPKYFLYIGCEGDETADALTYEEREVVMKYVRSNDEMDKAEKQYTAAIYNGMEYQCPLYLSDIEEAAKTKTTEYILGDLSNGDFDSFGTEEEAMAALEEAISDGTRANLEAVGGDGCHWQDEDDCRAAAEEFFYIVKEEKEYDEDGDLVWENREQL